MPPLQPNVRAILLDLGNVLAFHDNALLFRRLAERAGRTGAEVARVLESPLAEDINRGRLRGDAIRIALCEALDVELGFDEFSALWNCHFTLHDAVLPRVESLLGRVKLVLLSNTNDLHFEFLRPRLPILERFDGLVLSHEVGLVKPEPAIFETALRMAGTRAEETAFFDDLGRFVEAADRMGIRGRLFTDAERFDAQLRELGLP